MWSIAKELLKLLDGFFGIINQIWRYQFFNNDYVNKIFGGAIIVAVSWLSLKAVIELIMNFIVKSDGNKSPLSVYRGIVLAIVMMFLISPLFDFGHNISTGLTDAVISVSKMDTGSTAETTISSSIIQAMIDDSKMKPEDVPKLIANWKTIDINDTYLHELHKVYNYSLSFMVLVIVSVITIFLLFYVAIQMAKRVLEIALFKIIGPFCCTSLTNNGRAFDTWVKSTMGLFLVTVVQFVSIGLMLNMFGDAIKDNGIWTGIFLIIGALLFVIGTPAIINSLLGQQSGAMSAFGELQSMMALGHGVSSGISVATGGLAAGVSVAPKTAGHISGVKQQFSNFKANGDSTAKALGKTVGSEVSRPIISAYNKAKDSFSNHFNNSKATASSNPFKMDTSNPFKNPHNMQYNPLRDQYTSKSGLETNNNNIDGGDS